MKFEQFTNVLREVLKNNSRIVQKAKLPNTVIRQFIKTPDKQLSLQNITRIAEFIDVEFDVSFKDKDGKILSDSELDSLVKKKISDSEEGDSLKIISGAKSVNTKTNTVTDKKPQKMVIGCEDEDKIISETVKIDFSDVFGA